MRRATIAGTTVRRADASDRLIFVSFEFATRRCGREVRARAGVDSFQLESETPPDGVAKQPFI